MSIGSLLARGQRAAEALMTDTCSVKYATGAVTQDPDTGTETPTYATRISSSVCKVQARNLVARDEEVGGRTATSVRVEVHLPVSADQVEPNDILTITAVGDLSDVQLLGRSFRVLSPVGKSFATARRLEVEEVVA